MSKIGKQPIDVPDNVTVSYEDRLLKVSGPKGGLEIRIPGNLDLKQEDGKIKVFSEDKDKISQKAYLGTYRSIIANMVKGVSEGWSKQLELVGVGFRAESTGSKLTMTLGFSHPVIIEAPEPVTIRVEKNIITIEGPDKEIVGLISDKIRSIKPPEPYKGKGIKYLDEKVRRKAGKAAKVQGAAA